MKFVTFLSSAVVTTAVLLVPSLPAHAAGSASLSLAAPGSANVGTTLPVTIYENGDNVNVVTADLSYDAGALQFVSIDASNSGFGSQAHNGTGNGTVEVSRYATDGNGNPTTVSGSQVVAVVDFKVLAGSGSTAVSTTSGSQVASNGFNIWDGAISSTSTALSTPAPVVRTAPVAVAPTPVAAPAPVATPTPAPVAKKTTPINTKQTTVEVKQASHLADYSAVSLILLALIAAFVVTVMRRRSLTAAAATGVYTNEAAKAPKISK